MAKTKALAEQHDNSKVAPTVEQQQEAPIKQARPMLTALARKAIFPPPGEP